MKVILPVQCITTIVACLAGAAAAMSQDQVFAASGASRGTGPAALQRGLLDAHNTVRAGLKLPSLQWSDRLASHAQEWANTLLARRAFSHRPKFPYGENLFEIRGGTATPADVVGAWVSESRDYDHRTNSCRGVCGHYTQVVWRDTRSLGCAMARGAGREVWVCNYDPPGNWEGERPF